MDSTFEHNLALQQNGSFSAADLEENRQGRYSSAQLKRFDEERNFIQNSAGKYDNKKPVIRLIFGTGLILFIVILYFFGVFDILKDILGNLFVPILLVGFALAGLMAFVVIPRQYQSSVDAYKAMGTSLVEKPLGAMQVIEARAEVYTSQGGINRRGRQSSHVSHILQMDSIKFNITASLKDVIQSKRKYRVYAVNDQGVWVLLSMEILE